MTMKAVRSITRVSRLQGAAELANRDPVLAGIVERYAPRMINLGSRAAVSRAEVRTHVTF
jgi:hypothetical protein